MAIFIAKSKINKEVFKRLMLISKKRALTSINLGFFILINVGFIFLQIHKQSRFVQLTYGWQRLEKEQAQLNKQRNYLIHKLHLQQNRKAIQKYARHKLGMQQTSVNKVHKVVLDQTNSI